MPFKWIYNRPDVRRQCFACCHKNLYFGGKKKSRGTGHYWSCSGNGSRLITMILRSISKEYRYSFLLYSNLLMGQTRLASLTYYSRYQGSFFQIPGRQWNCFVNAAYYKLAELTFPLVVRHYKVNIRPIASSLAGKKILEIIVQAYCQKEIAFSTYIVFVRCP